MTPEQEKRIFVVYASTRLFGLALFLLGVAIAYTNLVQPGGSPTLGGLMAIGGALYAVLAPRYYRRAMERRANKE